MPRVKTGEMSVEEIRNLVRQHNKLSHIDVGQSRSKLISDIKKAGYILRHDRKTLVKATKGAIGASNKKGIQQSSEGEQKPQKRTIKKKKVKALIEDFQAGGDIFSRMSNDPAFFTGGRDGI